MFYQQNMPDYTPNDLDPKYTDILKERFIRDVANIQEVDFAGNPQLGSKITIIINTQRWARSIIGPRSFKTF